jgi:hypothetical protein
VRYTGVDQVSTNLVSGLRSGRLYVRPGQILLVEDIFNFEEKEVLDQRWDLLVLANRRNCAVLASVD